MSPKKVDRTARRRHILDAAAGVFAEYGYRQSTIDQVAAAAAISKGAVYLYFDSKEALFQALFDQFVQDAMPPADALMAPPEDARAALLALFDTVMRSVDANPAMIPLTLEFWSACGVAETRAHFGARYAELFGQFRALLAGLIEQGAQAGQFRDDLPAEALASALMAMIDGLLLQQWTDPQQHAGTTVAAALPVLLQALEKPA